MKVKVLVTRSCLTLCKPMDCSPTGSSVRGILQARIAEWVAMRISRDLPDPGMKPRSPTLQTDSLLFELPKAWDLPVFMCIQSTDASSCFCLKFLRVLLSVTKCGKFTNEPLWKWVVSNDLCLSNPDFGGSMLVCWRRKWEPTPVFLPQKSHGQRSLAGYSP